MKDKKALIFYFLMTIILFDFGNQIRKLSFNPYFEDLDNPIFSIIHITNTGSAWGLFEDKTVFLSLLAVFALIFLSYYVVKNLAFKDKFPLLCSVLFASGALGNLVERIKFGYVVDYIKLNFVDFAIFNCFDIFIFLSVTIYFFFVLVETIKQKKESK